MNHPIRILLVDDSPYFLEAARDFLQFQKSFEVIGSAMDGDKAVEESRRLVPDIILLDLNLAGKSGLDLIPLFKQHIPQTKIIVLTIMQDEPYRTAALEKGADAFIRKTSMTQSLVSAITALMDRPPAVPPVAEETAPAQKPKSTPRANPAQSRKRRIEPGKRSGKERKS